MLCVSMKDVCSIKKASKGDSLKFLLSPSIQEALNLNHGDTVQMFITKISKEGEFITIVPVSMIGTVIKAGGTSKGVTIKKDIVELLKLKAGQIIEIEIQKTSNI